MKFCAEVCPDLAKYDIFKEIECLTLVAVRALTAITDRILHRINLYTYIHLFHIIDYDIMPVSTLFTPDQIALLQTRCPFLDSKRAHLVQDPSTRVFNKSRRE